MSALATIPLNELLDLESLPVSGAAFFIAPRLRGGRWIVELTADIAPAFAARSKGWWAVPHADCGDTPQTYHPKYIMAVLTAAPVAHTSGAGTDQETPAQRPLAQALLQWPLPRIRFDTEEFIRRSMALNGMRMSMEHFQSGSPRVLQLVRQRLEAGQRDIVHDVLVYLMQHTLDVRAEQRETRLLRSESVAAYLGVNQEAVNRLFIRDRLVTTHITTQITNGIAGPVRRQIDISELIEGQMQLLRPSLNEFKKKEKQVLILIDDIVRLLYETG